MTAYEKFRNWFFETTSDKSRFLKGDKPTEQTFRNLLKSITFKKESDDRAKIYNNETDLSKEQGLVVLATDTQVKTLASQLSDRSLVVQPSQMTTLELNPVRTITQIGTIPQNQIVVEETAVATRKEYKATLTTDLLNWMNDNRYIPPVIESTANLFVSDSDGDDATGDGSAIKPFKTIQHALSLVANNQTIIIYGGQYTLTGGPVNIPELHGNTNTIDLGFTIFSYPGVTIINNQTEPFYDNTTNSIYDDVDQRIVNFLGSASVVQNQLTSEGVFTICTSDRTKGNLFISLLECISNTANNILLIKDADVSGTLSGDKLFFNCGFSSIVSPSTSGFIENIRITGNYTISSVTISNIELQGYTSGTISDSVVYISGGYYTTINDTGFIKNNTDNTYGIVPSLIHITAQKPVVVKNCVSRIALPINGFKSDNISWSRIAAINCHLYFSASASGSIPFIDFAAINSSTNQSGSTGSVLPAEYTGLDLNLINKLDF